MLSFRTSEIDITKLDDALAYSLSQINKSIPDFLDVFPNNDSVNYIYQGRPLCSWTEGFWTGMLWLCHEFTGDSAYSDAAKGHLALFRNRIETRTRTDTHDLGFLYTLSAVAEYRLTGNEEAKRVAFAAADALMERYMIPGDFIQAWGKPRAKDNYRLIIDCMMNLPLLYWASETSGNPKYHKAAYGHLKTTLRTIIRHDASTYHTVFFNQQTGAMERGATHQGYSDDSCWARGQAWGIYGCALSYKYTKDSECIEAFRRLTEYYEAHLPADGVAFWDLCFTDGDNQPRDTSAAAIAVCGILEMNKYINEPRYIKLADRLMTALIDKYMTKDMPSNGLLKEGMYNRNDGHQSECTLWGDYYFLEAIMRYKNPHWVVYW